MGPWSTRGEWKLHRILAEPRAHVSRGLKGVRGGFARGGYHGRGKETGQGYTKEGEWADGLLKRGALRLDDGRWFEGEWIARYSALYAAKGVLGAADGTKARVDFGSGAFLTVDARPWPAPQTSAPL